MLFGSAPFLFGFLPIVLIGYFLTARRSHDMALIWLTGASLVFYGWWGMGALALLLFSILVNYAVCVTLLRRPSRRSLFLGIAFNLGLLGYFKYTNFLAANLGLLLDRTIGPFDIVLPLAISFYTFQQITYQVDIFNGKVRETRFLHYLLVVTFFPHLIAGPIIHPREIIAQLTGERVWRLTVDRLLTGGGIFVLGLYKKLVLADGIAVFVDPVFDSAAAGAAPSLIQAWGGALAYTLQLYFDFSGYSDMAVGLAWIFGLRLPWNFNSPYRADSIVEFWRRWHMTLSRFLKEYVYQPLGGNRRGSVRRHVNLMITMLVGGLWHGANWTFVAWGGYHGLLLAINHGWRGLRRAWGGDPERTGPAGRAAARVLTFVAVVFGWALFRSPNWPTAERMIGGMIGANGIAMPAHWLAGSGDWFTSIGGRLAPIPPFDTLGLWWLAALMAIVWFAPNTQAWVAGRLAPLDGEPSPGTVSPRLRAAILGPFLLAALAVSLLVVLARGDQAPDFIYMVF